MLGNKLPLNLAHVGLSCPQVGHVASKMHPSWLHDAPRLAQDGSKLPSHGTKAGQDYVKKEPRLAKISWKSLLDNFKEPLEVPKT